MPSEGGSGAISSGGAVPKGGAASAGASVGQAGAEGGAAPEAGGSSNGSAGTSTGAGSGGNEDGAGGSEDGAGGNEDGAGGAPLGPLCGSDRCEPGQYCRAACSGVGAGTGIPSCQQIPPACDGVATCDCVCGGFIMFCTEGAAEIQCGCA